MKVMKKFLIPIAIILFFQMISLSNSILIETTGKPQYCFHKNIDAGDTLYLSYVISGENEEKVNCAITHNGNVFYHQENSEGADFKQEIRSSGIYTLCFHPTNDGSYYISFEFFTNFEKGHTLDMAKDENLHEMKKDVSDISLMFEQIEKNVKFVMDRRKKHSDVLHDMGKQIRHINYAKILVILMVSLLQIFLIQRFFSGGKKTASYGSAPQSMFDVGSEKL